MQTSSNNMVSELATSQIPDNPQLFEQLFRSHYPMLCNFAKKFTGNLESAEEIVQEVFVKLWEKKRYIEFEGSIGAYLVTAVKNSSFNYIKHQKIKQSSESKIREENYPNAFHEADDLSHSELNTIILSAISKLPAQRKKVFSLSRHEGLKYSEIAEQMNISVKTVEAQMCKALSFLRSELKEYI